VGEGTSPGGVREGEGKDKTRSWEAAVYRAEIMNKEEQSCTYGRSGQEVGHNFSRKAIMEVYDHDYHQVGI
jgi:hypothetical protein